MSLFIRFHDDSLGHGAIGAKAENLLQATGAELSVPPFFVVTSEAFEAALNREQADDLRRAEHVSTVSAALSNLELHESIQSQVDEAIKRAGLGNDLLSLRPSLDWDEWKEAPAAALPKSRLGVKPEDVSSAIAEIWKSSFSERILLHRSARGLRLLPQAPAIIVQKTVRPDVSGLGFSVDLVTGQQTVSVIASVYGLSTLLSSGESEADLYRIDRDRNIVTRDIAAKRLRDQVNPDCEGGVARLTVPINVRNVPCLTDDQVLQIDTLVRKLERLLGGPQEVDWAIESGRLWLIAVRPVTGVGRIPDPDAPPDFWDSASLAEYLPGISTPLTISFVRNLAPEIARSFCRRINVPANRQEQIDPHLENLVGAVKGKICGNVRNWYRIFSLLPDYPANARYFTRVKGGKALPTNEEVKLRIDWRGRLGLIGSALSLIGSWIDLPQLVRAFDEKAQSALKNSPGNIARARPDELVLAYRSLMTRLQPHADVLVLAEFYAAFAWALLSHAARLWCSDETGGLVNDLLTGYNAGTNLDPRAALKPVATEIAEDGELVSLLQRGSVREIRRRLKLRPGLATRVDQLVDCFADRALQELKFESMRIKDDPLPIYRALGRMAQHTNCPRAGAPGVRERAEEFVGDAVGGWPIRHAIFRWLARQTRERSADYERVVATRRKIVARLREILLELGRRYYALGLLGRPDDVLYLNVDEALNCIAEGEATSTVAALTATRRAEYEQLVDAPSAAGADPNQRQGIACCRGTVRGRARLVETSGGENFEAGDILVVQSADPTWFLFYPTLGGILIANGGRLSHGAVVARSLGIPAIIAAPGLMAWLSDGDGIEMNGETGMVTRLEELDCSLEPENEPEPEPLETVPAPVGPPRTLEPSDEAQ